MIKSWWSAHEFEFVMWMIIVGALLVVSGIVGIVLAFRDSGRRRRSLDEALREESARKGKP